jgi:hypothetical protein
LWIDPIIPKRKQAVQLVLFFPIVYRIIPFGK